MIIEIETPNDPLVRQHGQAARFCAYVTMSRPGKLTTYPAAVREAIELGANACVGYVEEPVVVDYSAPVPSVLSRRKPKVHDLS
jgi:hypothetical protein